MLLKSFEMDARRAGINEGIQQGIQRGITKGAYQKSLETAKLMKLEAFDTNMIAKMTGLSIKEIENL